MCLSAECLFASRFAPADGHNSLWIMSAPITGCRGIGTVIGAALSIRGDESGPDFMAFMTSRR
jgi:hypothetical protein